MHTPEGHIQLWEESTISFKVVAGSEAGNEERKKGKECSEKKSVLICLKKRTQTNNKTRGGSKSET